MSGERRGRGEAPWPTLAWHIARRQRAVRMTQCHPNVAGLVLHAFSFRLQVELIQKVGRSEEKLFHFWFNASMLSQPKLVMRKWQLDGANKDRKHKKYNPHFRVELCFSEGPPPSESAQDVGRK